MDKTESTTPTDPIGQLQLLAQIDLLVEHLQQWVAEAPGWQPARSIQKLIHRLLERVKEIQIRIDAPLVAATLGGTGTGKSALINAILGQEVVQTGRLRPTTCKPVLVCRPELRPEMLGIPPSAVEVCHRHLPILEQLVLIDCPDPDSSESAEEAGSNLARLRQILPHCDVLLVTATKEKYRSGRVAEELAMAATGARLIFVQTHADTDEDIRADWQKVLQPHYALTRIFRIDCLQAFQDACSGRPYQQPEMAELVELLTRQLAGKAAQIRRANLLDLLAEALTRSREILAQSLPALQQFEQALQKGKHDLLEKLAQKVQEELQKGRPEAENRLLAEVISCWGTSPWSWVLRGYQSLGWIGVILLGRRLPGSTGWLLWGGAAAWQIWRKHQAQRARLLPLTFLQRLGWQPDQLQEIALRLQGYAWEAGFEGQLDSSIHLLPELDQSAQLLLSYLRGYLDEVVAKAAVRHTRWHVRGFYELLFGGAVAGIFYRLAKNFFWDAWLDPTPDASLYGIEFYLVSLFWLLVWTAILIWLFLARIRRGITRHLHKGLRQWLQQAQQTPLFATWETQCAKARWFQRELDRLEDQVQTMRLQLALPEGGLARRRVS